MEFRPTAPPIALKERNIIIKAESPGASTLLMFQAVFPYLLFAGNEDGDPVELEIHGSTNASFSPSYEYLDQVLLPTLEERFGIVVERQLRARAWTSGPLGHGTIWLRFQPIPPGQTLKLVKPWSDKRQPGYLEKMRRIDVSILVPRAMREATEQAMAECLGTSFPGTEIDFVLSEDSGHDARMYVLAVAHSESGLLRWGRDFLYDRSAKKKQPVTLARELAKTATKRLYEQVAPHTAAAVDEHLQDQLVVFQALAEGSTTYWSRATEEEKGPDGDDLNRGVEILHLDPGKEETKRKKKDRTDKPFGFGSTHATTARWVASELMPTVQWFNNGTLCEGAGVSM